MTSLAQRSFASGEVAPALWPRTDVEAYARGLRTLRNFAVMRSGGAQSRAGTEFIANLQWSPASNRQPRHLLDWMMSDTLNYLLEVGTFAAMVGAYSSYLRVWKDGERVTVTGGAWGAAQNYLNGNIVTRDGVTYRCSVDHTSTSGTDAPGTGATWQTYWHALENGILEIPLPYTLTALAEMQVADANVGVRYFAHALHPHKVLTRETAAIWSFKDVVYTKTDPVDAPATISISAPTGEAADFTRYFVTAVDGLFEGEPSAIVGWNKKPGEREVNDYARITITWAAVTGADAYNIYRSRNGAAFTLYQTVIGALTYTDTGVPGVGTPYGPPSDAVSVATFDAAGEYPGVIGLHQQRLIVSGLTNKPDTVYASKSAALNNFSVRSPIVDDDALSWRQVASRLNRVRHLVEVTNRLFALTETAECIVTGDTDGILRPGEPNPRTISFNGAAQYPRPLNVNTALLYVQARGGIVRDIVPAGNGIESDDLTALAHHLVDGHQIVSWCYQQTPHSIIWMVREDGVLLSLTYLREQGLLAWARHDTGGGDLFESVAVVQEYAAVATRDVVYALVNRNGDRYLERFSDREASSPLSRFHVDSAVTTYTLVTPEDADTVETDAGAFVGNGATLVAGTPDRLEETDAASAHNGSFPVIAGRYTRSRYEFEAYLEADERSKLYVTLTMNGGDYFTFTIDLTLGTITTMPSGVGATAQYTVTTATLTPNGPGYDLVLRVDPSAAYLNTSYAAASLRATLGLMDGVDTVYDGTLGFGLVCDITVNRVVTEEPPRLTGLTHLEGREVSVAGDEIVLASPATATRLVTSGTVVLTQTEYDTYSDFVVGLPIIADLETLDIDTVNGRSMKEQGIAISRLGAWVEASRPFWAGPQEPVASVLDGLSRVTPTDASGVELTADQTGYLESNLLGRFAKSGRIFIRHIDPTPLTVLAVMPQGKIGG